jgi:hypothetical protein
MNGAVVTGYAETVESAAAELDSASAGVGGLLAEHFGDLAASAGIGASYERASTAVRRQLDDGAAALRSAAEALRLVTSHHGGREDEAAESIKRAGSLTE